MRVRLATLARGATTLCAAALLAACGPRQVEVRSAPSSQAEVSIHLTNNLSQAVNVYVAGGGSPVFVRQVPANATEHLPVRGIAAGSTVTLRATTIDGARTYERRDVVLNGMFAWALP